ncbi:MAG: lipopolysaccharide biosynthesis protein [Rhodospirillales bacterium]|nr:lipopolysaccharide biosynthesis protein [Rhodospirillales bacterium]
MISKRFSTQGLRFVSTIILARILSPEDFGILAMAAMILHFIEAISDPTFEVQILKKDKVDPRLYDTVWTFQVIRGFLIATLLLVLAPFLADFFSEPRLDQVLLLVALTPVIDGFKNVGLVLFEKDMNFKKQFLVETASVFASAVVAITLGLLMRTYWPLIIGMVVASATRFALSYAMHPYRPRPSLFGWRDTIGIGAWLLVSRICSFIESKAGDFAVGRLIGTAALGYFSIAFRLSDIATQSLMAPARRVLLPGYAKMANDPRLLQSSFLDVLSVMLIIGAPVGAGMALTAEPLVEVLLGSKWQPAVPLIQILGIFGIVTVCVGNIEPTMLVLDKARLFVTVRAASTIVLLPVVYWGCAVGGAIGAAWALLATSLVRLSMLWALALYNLDLSVVPLLRAVWRTLAAVGVMSLVVTGLKTAFPDSESFSQNLVELLSLTVAGAASYVVSHLLLWLGSGKPSGGEQRILSLVHVLRAKRNLRSA